VVKTFKGEIPSVIGIYFSLILDNHYTSQRFFLMLAEKAPIYDTNSEANRASPIILKIFSPKSFTFWVHLLFSPAKPLTSFSAANNLA